MVCAARRSVTMRQDHVREVEMSPVSENVWYSASYDQKVRYTVRKEEQEVISAGKVSAVEKCG